jgi:hypothetical protein
VTAETREGGTMTKMTTKVKTQKSEKVWFFLGALAVFFMGVPYLVLGKDSVFVYHDQLDGEVIAYLLQARHLWMAAVYCRNS